MSRKRHDEVSLTAAFNARLTELRDAALGDLPEHVNRDAMLARMAWPNLGRKGQYSKIARIRAAGWIARPRVALEVARALGVSAEQLFVLRGPS